MLTRCFFFAGVGFLSEGDFCRRKGGGLLEGDGFALGGFWTEGGFSQSRVLVGGGGFVRRGILSCSH